MKTLGTPVCGEEGRGMRGDERREIGVESVATIQN